MHRIEKNTNLSALAGKSVEQICIGVHQVILRLEDDLYISIEGNFSFETQARQEDYRTSAKAFADLLDHRIVDAEVLCDDAVGFKFSNGTMLTIFDSSDYYESFQIKLPDRLLVV